MKSESDCRDDDHMVIDNVSNRRRSSKLTLLVVTDFFQCVSSIFIVIFYIVLNLYPNVSWHSRQRTEQPDYKFLNCLH